MRVVARLARHLAAALLAAAGLAAGGLRAQLPARPDPAEPVLVVRGASGAGRSLWVYTAPGPSGPARYVSAADVAGALRGRADVRGDRARVDLGRVSIEVADGVPFARVEGREVPLAVPPRVAGGRAFLPLQLVADALPAASGGTLRFDPTPRTLAVVTAPSEPEAAPTVVLPSIIGRPPARPAPATVAASPGPDGAGPVAGAPAASAAVTTVGPAVPVRTAARRRTIVVDAGHGGVDPGMRGAPRGGPAVLEKDVTLGVARALAAALELRGLDVVLTRDRDELIALAERGRIANARGGELFVSIHVNAANPGTRNPGAVRGFETYFLSDARTEDARQVAERENASVRFEAAAASTSDDPLRFIVSDLAQNEHLRVSQRLAQTVQRRLGRVHPGPNRGVHQAGFKVLVTASMPAVLVELGYGSNAADAAYLTSAAGQRALADAIADAVVEHVGRYAGERGAGEARR